MKKEIFDNILEVKEEYPDLTKIDDIELLSFLVKNLREKVIENSKISVSLNPKVSKHNYTQAIKLRTENQNNKDFLLGYLNGLLLFSNKFWEKNPVLEEFKDVYRPDFEDRYNFVAYATNLFLLYQKRLIKNFDRSIEKNKNLCYSLPFYKEGFEETIYDMSLITNYTAEKLEAYTSQLEENLESYEERRIPLLFFHSFFTKDKLHLLKAKNKNPKDFQLGLFAGTIRATFDDNLCQIINTKYFSETTLLHEDPFIDVEEITNKRYKKHVTNNFNSKTLKKQRIN